MKTSAILRVCFSIVVGLYLFQSELSAASRKPLLRYRFSEGQTNVYSVQIESRGENGTETLVGNVTVTCRAGQSNVICLALRGMLTPKRDMGGRMPYYGGGPNYPRWMNPVPLGEGCEIQIDDRGRVLRAAGDYPLPIPLGTLAQSLVETLPESAESRWETTEELAVMDDPQALGPATTFSGGSQPYGMPYYGGGFGGRNLPAVVAVTRKLKYETKGTTNQNVTIQKRLGLDSQLRSGAEPRISANGDGEFELDHESGLLRRVVMQFKSVVNTETVTRRTTISLRVTLLEGKERESVLQSAAPAPGTPPRKLSSAEVQKIIEDLKSSDSNVRRMAASKLQNSELTEAPPALIEIMAGAMAESDMSMRMAAVKVIADFGTVEHVPALIRVLKDEDFGSKYAAIRGLGRLKDKRAIETLVVMVASGGSDNYQATEALGKFGPEAEDAVLTLLKEKHNESRRSACTILKQIGTSKSIEPLREAMLDPNQMVSQAAAEAVRSIKARE